jgi:hypothetical protein
MFSTNPYTRRRQQKTAALFVVSGVLAAVGLVQALRAQPALRHLPQLRHTTQRVTPNLASFGRVALSPDGTREVEFKGDTVYLRDRKTQLLIGMRTVGTAQGVRFSPDGKELLVHQLLIQRQPGAAMGTLSDQIRVLDGFTAQETLRP